MFSASFLSSTLYPLPIPSSLSHPLLPQIDETYNESDERPITSVQVDGLVVLKILQHAQESVPELVSGQCMGLGNDDVLEITHSFPLISRKENDDVWTSLFVSLAYSTL